MGYRFCLFILYTILLIMLDTEIIINRKKLRNAFDINDAVKLGIIHSIELVSLLELIEIWSGL